MRQGTPPIASLERALDLLQAVVRDGGKTNVSRLAKSERIPPASAHRIVRTFARCNFLREGERGCFVPGPALLTLSAEADEGRTLAALARPALKALAKQSGRIAHLGVLENDMVTYLLKAGKGGDGLFTREGMQLEAYCSAIGKALLSHLPEEERELYLSRGPFIALTENTTTDPAQIREELEKVRSSGFAMDDREVAPDLICYAVPVRWPDGSARVAISLSSIGEERSSLDSKLVISAMRHTASIIEQRMFNPAA